MVPSDAAQSGDYVGWAVGGLVILAVFGVAAALWFHYHGFP
jgi:hypothetical protein